MTPKLIVYGSTGYTGKLVADLAVHQGIAIVLAGRNEEKLRNQSALLGGVEWQKASLEDPASLDALLLPEDRVAVLHCAGPFFRTWKQMASACLRNGVHYLDITGEIDVFEGLSGWSDRFKEAGVMAMPGTGFDVVPTDLVASELAAQLPDAVELELAFMTKGTRASHGTASSVASRLGNGGVVRREGEFKLVPTAWQVKDVEFEEGKPRRCVSIPWGDVSTAYHSTGIRNITVYMSVPPSSVKWLKASNAINPLLRTRVVRGFIQKRIDQGPEGPTPEQRETGQSLIWGRVKNAAGETRELRLKTHEGYKLTAMTSVAIAGAVLAGRFEAGFQTPSRVFRKELKSILKVEW